MPLTFTATLNNQASPSLTDNGYTITAIEENYGIYHAVHSNSMDKEFPVLVFLPKNYQTNEKEFPVVYMLHGVNRQPLTEEGIRSIYNSSTLLLEAADMFQVIIVCPLVGISFYIDSPKRPEWKFATFVGQEVPAFIDTTYRTVKSREGRFLGGFSMGGYGAISLLCRYPDTFSVALSRAGVVDLGTAIRDLDWDEATGTLEVLGSYWDNQQSYHLNGCLNLVNRIRDRKDVFIVQEIGREDFLYKCNSRLNQRLNELGMNHIYAEYPGGHEWSGTCVLSLLSHLQYCQGTIFKKH